MFLKDFPKLLFTVLAGVRVAIISCLIRGRRRGGSTRAYTGA